MRNQVIGDLHCLHSNVGVVEGTVGLLVLWLALALIERRGRSIGALIAKSIRQPLLLGLSASLYLGWLGQQIAKKVAWLDGSNALKMSAAITVIAIVWAIHRLGHALMETRRFESWLQMDDPKDRSMAISFLSRIFTILIVTMGAGALMLTLGVPVTALAALGAGAGVGLALAPKTLLRISSPDSCCFSIVHSRKEIGSAQTEWKGLLKISAGITHACAPSIGGQCISPTQSLPPIASLIRGKCTTAGSWQTLA